MIAKSASAEKYISPKFLAAAWQCMKDLINNDAQLIIHLW